MLDKSKLFSIKPKIKKVFIKSLNEDIFVKEFVVAERNKVREANKTEDYQLIMMILGICDKDGVPIFDIDDVEHLSNLPQVIADELMLAVVDHNEPKDSLKEAKKSPEIQ